MIKVTDTVEINNDLIRVLTDISITALERTGAALKTDLIQRQVIPRDTGDLQNQRTSVDYSESARGTVSLIHDGPYARRLYHHPEYNFSHLENPNAKGRWLDDYLPGGSRASWVAEAFASRYKRLLGKKGGTV